MKVYPSSHTIGMCNPSCGRIWYTGCCQSTTAARKNVRCLPSIMVIFTIRKVEVIQLYNTTVVSKDLSLNTWQRINRWFCKRYIRRCVSGASSSGVFISDGAFRSNLEYCPKFLHSPGAPRRAQLLVMLQRALVFHARAYYPCTQEVKHSILQACNLERKILWVRSLAVR